MISRYSVKEIEKIWSIENKLKTWLKVEIAHLEVLQNREENFLEEELRLIKENVCIDKERWLDIEKVTKHDVQAFVQMLEEKIPKNAGRWIHFGLTSSDILDTSLSILAAESIDVVLDYIVKVIYTVDELIKSESAKEIITARTHGKAAEIQTYSDIFNRWMSLLRNSKNHLVSAEKNIRLGKLSGATGNYKFNNKQSELDALKTLELTPVTSSQIISRQYYLDYFYAIMQTVLTVEKIAYDIRMYSIEGIEEMSEPFSKGQKGSSAMPHKKNPILTENICGLTRLYKGYFQTAVENCTTLFERDISHSSTERIIFEDASHIACFILKRINVVLANLNINVDNAKANCKRNLLKVSSQEKMTNLIRKGLSRKEAHDIAQNLL